MREPIENGDRVKIHERLATLETQLNTVLTNHLPHLQKGIDELYTRLNWIVLLLITNLVGIVFEIIRHTTIK